MQCLAPTSMTLRVFMQYCSYIALLTIRHALLTIFTVKYVLEKVSIKWSRSKRVKRVKRVAVVKQIGIIIIIKK